MEKILNCIMCPIGCEITVSGEKENLNVTGNTCPRGKTYALQEIIAPQRVITALFPITSGGVVSCKTSSVIPKEKIFDILKEIQKHKVDLPIKIGDVLLNNVCDTGVDVVATSNKND